MASCFRHILLSVSFLVVASAFQNCTRVNPSEVDTTGLMSPEVGDLEGFLGGGNLPGGVDVGAGGGAFPTGEANEGGAAGGTTGEAPAGDVATGSPGQSEQPSMQPPVPNSNPNPIPTSTPAPDPFGTCAECTASFFTQKTQAEQECYSSIGHLSFPLPISSEAKDITRQVGLSVTIEEGKAVEVRKVLGRVQVAMADTLEVNSVGSLSARANVVIGASAVRGGICLGAGRVQVISNINGQVNVAAQEINEISDISSNVRIYGGTVHSLKNIQGHVCLHDDAKVISYSNISGGIKNCD